MSWQTTKTSKDYTPAVAIWPSGYRRKATAIRLDTVEQAREKLAQDVRAVVAVDDAEAVKSGE